MNVNHVSHLVSGRCRWDGALVAHVVAFAWSEGKRGDNAESGEIANPGAPLGGSVEERTGGQGSPSVSSRKRFG